MNKKNTFRGVVCLLLLLPFLGVMELSANNSWNVDFKADSDNVSFSNLETALNRMKDIPYFYYMNNKEVTKIMRIKNMGKAQGVICGNSDDREEVLKILSKIPSCLLYSEYRDERDAISRCYIEVDRAGNAQMLYVFVGFGGNDLLAVLYKGARVKRYQSVADELKEVSYEEVEAEIAYLNTLCPQQKANGIEVESISIDRQYMTIRVNVNAQGRVFSDIFDEGDHKSIMTGFEKKQLGELFNLGLGVRFVMTLETGEIHTIVLEREELAEILNSVE